MKGKVMTQEELLKEVEKVVIEYQDHCIKQGMPGQQVHDRVASFEKMLDMCANEFQLAREQDKIPGEMIDWVDFYNGFLAGVQYGQRMTAESLGLGDTVNEATGQ